MLSYRKLAMRVLGHPLHTGGIDSPRPASQRVAAFILTAAMLTTLTAPAFAGTWYIEDGDITISAGESGNNVTQNENTTENDPDTIITNREAGASSHTVTIEANGKDDKVEVTLKDVNIDTSSRNKAAVSVTGEGDTNIKLNGDNALKSDIYRSGIYGSGSGSLTISGGENDSLTAQGGSGANGSSSSGSVTISGGSTVTANGGSGTISGGTFKEAVEVNAASGTEAKIEGGTFEKRVTLKRSDTPITISNGLFNGEVVAEECYAPLSISGGLFTNAVDVSSTDPSNLQITGGYFVNEPTLPVGSDIAFTSVSDQNGKAFQVPVNDGFSENSYKTLYVPHGISERQANPITVKTDTALTDCLADGESIMGTDKVRKNNDGSYTIEVYQPESIVLVTEKPAPPTPDKPDEPGDEIDPGFSSGAAALGIVLGTAGLGYVAYINGTSLYLHYALPDGFIPSTRQELANVLWTTAGKPDPVSTALYTDIPADNIEQQKAARWCVEQGLLSDHGATFGPDTTVTNARIIRAWNSLKKVPVPITN